MISIMNWVEFYQEKIPNSKQKPGCGSWWSWPGSGSDPGKTPRSNRIRILMPGWKVKKKSALTLWQPLITLLRQRFKWDYVIRLFRGKMNICIHYTYIYMSIKSCRFVDPGQITRIQIRMWPHKLHHYSFFLTWPPKNPVGLIIKTIIIINVEIRL